MKKKGNSDDGKIQLRLFALQYGCWLITHLQPLISLTKNQQFYHGFSVLFAARAFIIFVSFFECWGAILESHNGGNLLFLFRQMVIKRTI